MWCTQGKNASNYIISLFRIWDFMDFTMHVKSHMFHYIYNPPLLLRTLKKYDAK